MEKSGEETRDLLHAEMEKNRIQAVEIERLKQKSEEDHAAFQAALKQKDCTILETERQQQSLQQAVGSLQTQYTELIDSFLSYRSVSEQKESLMEETFIAREASLRCVLRRLQRENGDLKEVIAKNQRKDMTEETEGKGAIKNLTGLVQSEESNQKEQSPQTLQKPEGTKHADSPDYDCVWTEIAKATNALQDLKESREHNKQSTSRSIPGKIEVFEKMVPSKANAELEKSQLKSEDDEQTELSARSKSNVESNEETDVQTSQQLDPVKRNQKLEERSNWKTITAMEDRLLEEISLREILGGREISVSKELESLRSENPYPALLRLIASPVMSQEPV
uniref:Uncharacterized protein n=1 Tax=Knipowitschia caucasica TaxID=637954 RepID=A0AAV2L0T1_KNICA